MRSGSDGCCRPAHIDRGKIRARHAHVVERIVRRHKALVADEPVHAIPRDPASIGVGREQLIELFRARAAGQADRDAAGICADIRAEQRAPRPSSPASGSDRQLTDHAGDCRCDHLLSRASASCGRRASSSSSASSGPSLPASIDLRARLPPAFFQASRNGCTALPAGLDAVGALKQDVVADHAVVDQRLIAGATARP